MAVKVGTTAYLVAVLTAASAVLTASGTDDTPTSRTPPVEHVRVLTVDNPQMGDLQRLTAEVFTPATGIQVTFDARPENELRRAAAAELRARSRVHDVVSLGSYDLQVFADHGWLRPLDDVFADPSYDAADLMPAILRSVSDDAGRRWGVPFYGESSLLMYDRRVAAAAGVQVPEAPRWDEVAELAAAMDGALPGRRGICLRGLPGWGQMMAPLMTVVNTFGGTLFDADWRPRVDDAAFREATAFYLALIRDHGIAGSPQAGYTECLRAMAGGKVAMWYDSTAAAGVLEDARVSTVAGRLGYAAAPVLRTGSSGWLWTWAWSLPAGGSRAAAAATFARWAGSREYEQLVGDRLGWARVPAGKRRSTYADPRYLAQPFALPTLRAISGADPERAGRQPRPYAGIQYVPVPEFAELADRLTQHLNAVLAGTDRLDAALARGQARAEAVGRRRAGLRDAPSGGPP